MGKPTEQGLYIDAIADLSAGMNSDVPAIALTKNQASFLTNATCRGNYLTHRPPFNSIELVFDGAIQEAFEDGLFQGATYYRPDFGAASIIASVSGRLYKIAPGNTTAAISDITPTAGGNSSSGSPLWLWQGENYVFDNDGGSQTIIYNGSVSRYADAGTVVGTLAAPATIPAIGTPVAVTLSDAYTGPSGISVDVFSTSAQLSKIGQFQISTFTTGGQAVTLTNQNDSPGNIYPAGDSIAIRPSVVFSLKNPVVVDTSNSVFSFGCYLIGAMPTVGTQMRLTVSNVTRSYTIVSITSGGPTVSADQFVVDMRYNGPYSGSGIGVLVYPAGTLISLLNGPADTTVGTLSTGFTAPVVGGSVTADVNLTSAYANGDTVFIGSARYTIATVVTTPTTSVFLTPISLVSGVGQAIPSGAVIVTLAEIPPGRMGVYGLGRNWICLTDGTSYLASDIVGGSSGTIAYQFRDAILNVTENNYLAGGGVFRIPSSGESINAMRFPATLDSSLGQGPLQILTQTTTFSCNAPVQRSAWQDLTNPIQTQSLVGGGALSYYGTIAVNGDLWFRSYDGIRSLRLARQEFQTSFSNTPQSVEMNRVLIEDDRSLLNYHSMIVFDNRVLSTANPVQSESGVYHTKIIAMNLDPNSSLREKQAPIWEGEWTGLNVLQLITGSFSGVDRAFAITYDSEAEKIGLHEILPSQPGNDFDDTDERIVTTLESPALFYQPDTGTRQLLRLNDGEMIVKDLIGDVRFDVYYRPDYDTAWHSWHSWEVTDSPDYQPRMGLGQPNLKLGSDASGRPFAVGYHFQVKVVITGCATMLGMNFYAVAQPTPQFAKPLPSLTPMAP